LQEPAGKDNNIFRLFIPEPKKIESFKLDKALHCFDNIRTPRTRENGAITLLTSQFEELITPKWKKLKSTQNQKYYLHFKALTEKIPCWTVFISGFGMIQTNKKSQKRNNCFEQKACGFFNNNQKIKEVLSQDLLFFEQLKYLHLNDF
jgi:hypothetical protein